MASRRARRHELSAKDEASEAETRPFASSLDLDDVVLTAAGLDLAERERYLLSVAAEDPQLAATARRRLAAAAELPESFLDTPAAARLDEQAAACEQAPSVAALPAEERYELGECLGEGGMGRVLRAFDHQLGRTVALKLLTRENAGVRRLFLGEARSQAQVRHEHVLEIYDRGELDGQPFISMRYVAGGTLAEVGPTLPLEGKVRLLVQVAEGLHAAHRAGLLHRDVKPSNVLVDRSPDGELTALVTDFGLATELEEGASAAAGAIAGTPSYIAPERLSAAPTAVDRRADIYSLGVTMYELLTGARPFAGDDTVDLLRRVVEEDPTPPRQRSASLPAELEAVVLRCLARDPSHRYGSARAVAADLERYLDGEVVEAYAAGLSYRLTRFVLRHKLLLGLAAAAGLSLVVASVAVTVFALRADAARARAELRQAQAEELIDFMLVDLREKLESVGRLDVLDEVDVEATGYFTAVPEQELSELELLRQSRMLYQIGEVRIRQGDLAAAAEPMERSLALTSRLVELRPDDGERLFELGQSHFWVGFLLWERGELAAARAPFEAYLDISRQLVERDGENHEWRRELSYAHSNLGSLLQAEGDLEAALAQFRATLAIDRELVAVDPDNREAQSELAATHNTLGVVLQDLGRLSEAGEHLLADLEMRQALYAASPADARAREMLAASHGQLGIHRLLQGELAAARSHFQVMNEISSDLAAHDPANTDWRFQLAWSHLELGRVAYLVGDLERAAAHWREQRELNDRLLALDPTPHHWRRTRAIGLYHLALLGWVEGDVAALDTAGVAATILEQLAASRPSDRHVHRWLAWSHLLLGTLSAPESLTAFTRARAAIEPFARDSGDGRLLAPLASALACLGRLDEARAVGESLRLRRHTEPGFGELCGIAEAEQPAGL